MIAGVQNLIEESNTTISASKASIEGKDASKIISRDALEVWQGEDDTTITISFLTAFTARLICLFNVDVETNVTISVYDDSFALIDSKVITPAEFTGLEIKNTYFDLGSDQTIRRIVLAFNSTTSGYLSQLGFLWAGQVVDFGCLESYIPRELTADQLTIGPRQNTDVKDEYLYQTFDFITERTVFSTFRGKIRTLTRAGFFIPRPFIFNETFFTPPETLLAVFDASQVQYDNFFESLEKLTQATLGIIEVFA